MTDLPTLQALDKLWLEVSSRPLWAPPTFFRYLKLRSRMRLNFIDPKKAKVIAAPGQINACSSCTENCCVGKQSLVSLRLRDLALLQDLGRTELITHKRPQYDEEMLSENNALRRTLSTQTWKTFPVLKQNSYYACEALDADGKCTLYPHWPLSCERFPYSLHADVEEIFFSKRCRSFWVRPDGEEPAQAMALAAVAAYNETIKDRILLAWAPKRLEDLGLSSFLNLELPL
ncbi:YkgJ family cysteine cluster protein [Myxococcota bacterium]|nr:YkgJ family cysteine cluster protein [Myxococcota bacterium]